MVRWNTDRAVSIYGRFEREEYWKLLERAKAVDATSVQFTALPEIDEAQRLLEHLGLSNKTWPEITTQLMKLVPSIAEDISAAPRQPAVSTVASGTAVCQSVPVPSSTPSNTATRSVGSNKRELPPGFTCEVKQAKARSYQLYIGPAGVKAYSRQEAWRIYQGLPRYRPPVYISTIPCLR